MRLDTTLPAIILGDEVIAESEIVDYLGVRLNVHLTGINNNKNWPLR